MEHQRIGFLGYILRILNWILILALLVSYLAQWVSPEMVWLIAFFGLGFPVLYVLNIVFLLHWTFRRRKFLVYPLIVLLMGLPMLGRFLQLGSNTEHIASGNSLKVLSYNVHVLDYYGNKFGNSGFARDQIIEKMKLENADIYCMQEFYTKKKAGIDNVKLFKQSLETPYTFNSLYFPGSSTVQNVIFSKYPIISSGLVGNIDDSSGGIFADIEVNDVIIRVYSVHLESIQISSERNVLGKYMNLNSPEGQELAKKQSFKFINKFKVAFASRARQITVLKNHIANSQYPIIILGDLNDTPSSYAYSQLRADLDDAFVERGGGFGQTYIGKYPSFRIDNIFYDPQFTCNAYNTIQVTLSDHYPISAEFTVD